MSDEYKEKARIIFWNVVAIVIILLSAFYYDHNTYMLVCGLGLAIVTEVQRGTNKVIASLKGESR